MRLLTKLEKHFLRLSWMVVLFFMTHILIAQWDPMCPNPDVDCGGCEQLIYVSTLPEFGSGPGAEFSGDIDPVTCPDCMDNGMPLMHHCYKFRFILDDTTFMYATAKVGQGMGCTGNLDGAYQMEANHCHELAFHSGSQTYLNFSPNPGDYIDLFLCVNSNAQVSLCDVYKAQTPLAIEMAGIEVVPLYSTNMINWTTASEWNNHYFDVEKSNDGSRWTAFARIISKSGEESHKAYSAIDYEPYEMTYYRVKAVDYEGKETMSKVMSMQREGMEVVSVFPNPGTNELRFTVHKYDHGNLKVTLRDISGDIMLIKNLSNEDSHSIDINNVPGGVYLLRIEGKNIDYARKYVKLDPE